MALPNLAPPPKKSGFSPEIMDTLQKQNAPAKRMSPADIVKEDAQKNGSDLPWEQTYAALIEAVKSPQIRILRANNSLFVYLNEGNGQANGNLISADDPQTMVKSLQEFKQAFIKAGFKQLKSKTSNSEIKNAFKSSGMNIQENMNQSVVKGKGVPATQMIINLAGEQS